MLKLIKTTREKIMRCRHDQRADNDPQDEPTVTHKEAVQEGYDAYLKRMSDTYGCDSGDVAKEILGENHLIFEDAIEMAKERYAGNKYDPEKLGLAILNEIEDVLIKQL